MAVTCPKCQTENLETKQFCGDCGTQLRPPKGIRPEFTETFQTPVKELTTGSTFAGRYQVVEELGHGGMGRVYKVLDTRIGEKIALKLIRPEAVLDRKAVERFSNELKLARKIRHKNICQMFDLGEDQGTRYITMEYIHGEDLKQLIRKVGRLSPGQAIGIALQVCEGLEEAHKLGVVHRDLKPQNIMIDEDGNARIMDFGIARSLSGKGITGAGVMIGTPEYMSPEQVEGKDTDQRSDIYSLGVILYEMATGRVPFEGDTPFTIGVKHKSEPPKDPRELNAQLPQDLSRLILRCLEKDKNARYQTAAEVGTELEKIGKGIPTTDRVVPERKTLTSREFTVNFTLRKLAIPVSIIVAVAVLAFVVWQIVPQGESSKRSVAVIGFKNQTGDKAFDYLQETIPNLLITSLEQSGHFRVTSWQRFQDLLRLSGKGEMSALDEEAAFEICRKEGIEALVVGFYSKAGETFVTDVKVLDAVTKQSLKSAQSRGEGPASILKTQIDGISRDVSRGIGLPALKIEKAQPRIVDLTTGSLEAYQYFLKGRDEYEKFYYADSRKSLEKAVSLDPTFAVAYFYLAYAANNLSDLRARDEALEKAKKYAAKATEKERLSIDAGYAGTIERNPDKQLSLLKEVVDKYPQEKYAHFHLALFYSNRNRAAESIEESEKAIALDPQFGLAINQLAYAHASLGNFDSAIKEFERYAALYPRDANPLDSIAELYMRQGKMEEAAAKYQEVLRLKPDFFLSCLALAYVYALEENYPEANRWVEEFITRAPTLSAKAEGAWLKAFFGYLLGRWDESLADYLSLKKQFQQSGGDYLVATVDWITGFLFTDLGKYDLAREASRAFAVWALKGNASTKTFNTAALSFFSGWIDLKQERLPAAKLRLDEIQPLLPGLDSKNLEQISFLFQVLSAEVALAENSAARAIEIAEKTPFRNFQMMRMASIAEYNMPFLKDVLARAYWKKGELDRAIAEYERLLTIDPKNQVRLLIHPLYHYRLGRIYEEKGVRDKAGAHYKKFLEYWKDADEKIPEKADARSRLAWLK
jgi:serine/threonine protein kinase/tetratricopeptide (TPR) repeat protein